MHGEFVTDRHRRDDGQPAQYGTPRAPGGEPPLWAPWYGISFPRAFTRFWKKYAAFSGRASRSEYWWWSLWNVIVVAVLSTIVGVIAAATGDYSTHAAATSTGASAGVETQSPAGIILVVWYLAVLIPTIAIQVRRLHDVNLRGWWVLLALIPFLGGIAVLVMTILPSNPEGQRFDRPTS
ncbi:DUF805 domain-containing protein [Curtobacterium sp. RRHDQ10]|uniref:DUF805 domain-containing protein n=1 Tax=Curtobacterium phyllosphaerae TaxID=3413379 RepID=UPI003BEFED4B